MTVNVNAVVGGSRHMVSQAIWKRWTTLYHKLHQQSSLDSELNLATPRRHSRTLSELIKMTGEKKHHKAVFFFNELYYFWFTAVSAAKNNSLDLWLLFDAKIINGLNCPPVHGREKKESVWVLGHSQIWSILLSGPLWSSLSSFQKQTVFVRCLGEVIRIGP